MSGGDATPLILRNDSVYWESNVETKDFSKASDLHDGVIVTFPKPRNAETMKLVVTGGNTPLGGYAFPAIPIARG